MIALKEPNETYDNLATIIEDHLEADTSSLEFANHLQDYPSEMVKLLLTEMTNKSEITYAEYIKHNLFKLNDDLLLLKDHIKKQMTTLQRYMKAELSEDDEELFKTQRFIRNALESFDLIPETEKVNCLLYLERMIREARCTKTANADSLSLVKSQLKEHLVKCLGTQFDKGCYNNMCMLGFKDDAAAIVEETFWHHKSLTDISESLTVLKSEYGFDAEELVVNYILKQERLFAIGDLDQFVQSYNEVSDFVQSISPVASQKIMGKWQLNSYLNLR